MQISRRQLLALGGALAAAGAVAGGSLAWRWWDQPPEAGWEHLSPDEVAFLDALSDATFPPGGEPALGGLDANLTRFVDGFMGALGDDPRGLLKLLLHAMDTWPLPAHGELFSALEPEARAQVLQNWINHDLLEIRSAIQSLVLLLGMGYTIHPDAVGTFQAWFPCGYGA